MAPSTAVPSPDWPPNALPVGTEFGKYKEFGKYELRDVLGVGGFGIVYLAFDHSLEREVAIKEYLPATIASRIGERGVTVASSRTPRPSSSG